MAAALPNLAAAGPQVPSAQAGLAQTGQPAGAFEDLEMAWAGTAGGSRHNFAQGLKPTTSRTQMRSPRVDDVMGGDAEPISDPAPFALPRMAPVSPITPPALAARAPASGAARPKRWSVDAWGFWRQGSDAAPISQSRVPIYGASQIGAIAQYRLAPAMGIDPRVHARAYRAMVPRGENELSLGGSLRPLARVPVRAFAEMRYTDAAFGTEWRPALFVVSEFPPQALPAGFSLEAYGQAGWVGGDFATGFADGQVAAVREVVRLEPFGSSPLRFSAGAGAWGGVQRDAGRLDVGPTVRLEWTMGRVPARLSIDWREQVSGDAAPQSGVAATLATGF